MSTKAKNTPILKMDKRTGQQWCMHRNMVLQGLWLREKQFYDDLDKHSIIHAQRAQVVGQEVEITSRLILLLIGTDKTLDGLQANPFPNELGPDEAREWLAETRMKLMTKVHHERAYLKKCEGRSLAPHPDAATEVDIQVEQEMLGLLDELLATFPPLRLPQVPKEN